MVEKRYATKMAKTEFFGEFFALLNIISLFMQFFLTSKILKKFGIGITLVLMPLVLALGSAGFLFLPTILLASFLKISAKTLGYSLMQSSRELLFLPIPSEIRVKAKLLITVFVNRLASGVAAGLIIFFTLVFPISVAQLSIVALVFLTAWIEITIAVHREYITSIKRLLVRRDVDIEERVIQTLDAETINTLIKSLTSKDSHKVLFALSLLELVPTSEIEGQLMPLLNHWDAKIRTQTLAILRIVFILREAISIIFVEPILCPKPHKPLTVLKNKMHCGLRESLFKEDMLKFYMILLGVHVCGSD